MKMQMAFLMAVLLALMSSVCGCDTGPASTQPASPVVILAENIGLRVAYGQLQALKDKGKITPAQFDAGGAVIAKANAELQAGKGTLTQDQVDAIVAEAAIHALNVYLPNLPTVPTTQP